MGAQERFHNVVRPFVRGEFQAQHMNAAHGTRAQRWSSPSVRIVAKGARVRAGDVVAELSAVELIACSLASSRSNKSQRKRSTSRITRSKRSTTDCANWDCQFAFHA